MKHTDKNKVCLF